MTNNNLRLSFPHSIYSIVLRKWTPLFVAAILCTSSAYAMIQPLRMNFRGKLIDPTTNNPRSGLFSLKFSIYNVPTAGVALYTETQTNVPVTNGVFSVQIGSVTALSRDLFLGASAYLGVTITNPLDPGGEMAPRMGLVMSPYAFTANQLSDLNEVRLIAGPTYSTFTSAGNLTIPGGIVASSGSFTNGVTASSGTFTATGNTQFSVMTSSGIRMQSGSLNLTGTSGINASDNGIILSSIAFVGQTLDPAGVGPGYLYYNSSTGAIKISDLGGRWDYIFGQDLGAQNFSTTNNTAATAAKATAATVLVLSFYLSHPMMVNSMHIRVTTALGAAGDIGIYDNTGALVLNGGSSSVSTAVGAKLITPTQAARFLGPGNYYAAATWNSTTGIIGGDVLGVAGLINRVGTVVGGGLVLPASITPTAITAGTINFFFEFNP
jgi:hypothetical protein